MNKEEPYRDQAERLKRRIEKTSEKVEDIDPLPPREQIHRQKKKKIKWKLKYPVIRLLVLFFILLPIIIFSVISMYDHKKNDTTVKTSVEPVGYEPITLEKSKNSKGVAKKQEPSEGNNTTTVKSNESSLQGQQDQSQETTNQTAGTNGGGQNTAAKDSNNTIQTNTNTNSNTSQTVSTVSKTKVTFHTVQPKETLFSIAKKYYNSPLGMDIIRKANLLKDDHIETGQVLKIPLYK